MVECIHEKEWGEMKQLHIQISQDLKEIKIQTKLTNGRVGKLELFRTVMSCILFSIVGTFIFMLIAHQVGWIDTIIEYGGQ